tara:strand:+ start:56353 stop:56997 length:645 start_codon:yes stop_codon:yes gene_type:complete
MKIAIMQPYFAPYLGYFQLINEVDLFVFYDDVNFINRGWINRNNVTINGNLKLFTIPLIKSSQNKKIKDIEVNWNSKEMNKLLKTFRLNLKNKPKAMKIVESIFQYKPKNISDTSILSIKLFCKELGIKTKFEKSSEIKYIKSKDRLLNLVQICKSKNISNYINAEGGQKLYTKEDFNINGINLKFLKGTQTPSILDIIDSPNIQKALLDYETI